MSKVVTKISLEKKTGRSDWVNTSHGRCIVGQASPRAVFLFRELLVLFRCSMVGTVAACLWERSLVLIAGHTCVLFTGYDGKKTTRIKAFLHVYNSRSLPVRIVFFLTLVNRLCRVAVVPFGNELSLVHLRGFQCALYSLPQENEIGFAVAVAASIDRFQNAIPRKVVFHKHISILPRSNGQVWRGADRSRL